MSITTYAELKSAIASWLNRDDLASTIPDFISMVEADMSRTIRHWRMEKRSTADLTTQYSALPSDFYEPIRLSLTSGTTYSLELASQADLLRLRQRTNNVAGRPRYYAITDGSIEVIPPPDATYTLEMVYYSKIIPLTDANTSNWVLDYYPDAYLYGSLIHSAPFLSDDTRLSVWASLYKNAVDAINKDSDKAKFGGSSHRMKIRSF